MNEEENKIPISIYKATHTKSNIAMKYCGIILTAIFFILAIQLDELYKFYDPPSILFVSSMTICATIFAYGLKFSTKAIFLPFLDRSQLSKEDLQQYVNFYNMASLVSICAGIIGFLIGMIKMLAENWDNIKTYICPAIALCLVTIFYGFIAAALIFQPMKYAVLFNANKVEQDEED